MRYKLKKLRSLYRTLRSSKNWVVKEKEKKNREREN